jgi:hypothetical protein
MEPGILIHKFICFFISVTRFLNTFFIVMNIIGKRISDISIETINCKKLFK